MNQTAKPLTKQKIQSVLRRAGHHRAEWTDYCWSVGYRVRKEQDGRLLVTHEHYERAEESEVRERLAEYRGTLEASGIAVEESHVGRRLPYLIATGYKNGDKAQEKSTE